MTELPDLAAMRPKAAHRAWTQWLADVYPLDGKLIMEASGVGMAIAEYDLNFGKEAEPTSRKNLADRVAAFRQHCSVAAD